MCVNRFDPLKDKVVLIFFISYAWSWISGFVGRDINIKFFIDIFLHASIFPSAFSEFSSQFCSALIVL